MQEGERKRGKLTLLLRPNTGEFVPCRAHLECQHLGGKTIFPELKFWVFLVPVFGINIICSGKKKVELKMSINCSTARAVRSGNRAGPES